ncbi:MAG: cyclic pyranopterin monophosphate synthase MoaC [Candidatus Baldrarchaeia archaeon]
MSLLKEIRMVDIGGKPDVLRIARAVGRIKLKSETIERIRRGEIEKGDVRMTAQIAAIMAVKKTPEIVPLCHPIPITGIDVDVNVRDHHVEVEVEVRSIGKTGVEMEALVGVSAALLAIWDMVKAYEKDEQGQYPYTVIEEIRVASKTKEPITRRK